MPKISVIIPTYNRAHLICETIDSVLGQTFQDFEIIVIDNVSTDNTKDVLRKYGDTIQYLYLPKKGLSLARNYGLMNMSGEYVALLDSDDIFLPRKLEKQAAYLDAHPDIGAVFSQLQVINQNGTPTGQIKPIGFETADFEGLLKYNFCTPSASLIRRSALTEVGLFNESMKASEDYELFLRFALKKKMAFIPEVLVQYRESEDSMTRDMLPFYIHGIRMYKELKPLCSPQRRRLINKKLRECYWLLAQEYSKKGNKVQYFTNYILSKIYFLIP